MRSCVLNWKVQNNSLVIVETHHKDYIQRLKQERKKTLSSIDNIYNMNGMEYEDLYTKMANLVLQYNESAIVIRKLRGEVKASNERLRKAKMTHSDHLARYEMTKKHIEQFRNEHEKLEDQLYQKNKEIEKLEEKIEVLEADKTQLRKDYIGLKHHIEVVVETPSEHPSLDEKVEDKAISTHSDDSIEIVNAVEKKIQTATCVMKNKASQTDQSWMKQLSNKKQKRSRALSHNTNSGKSIPSHNFSESKMDKLNIDKNINLDLINDDMVRTPSNSNFVTREILWSQNHKKRMTQAPVSFLSTDPNNSHLFSKNMLPKLKNFQRGASKDFMLSPKTSRPRFPESLVKSPNDKYREFSDNNEEKVSNRTNSNLNKLKSIYGNNRSHHAKSEMQIEKDKQNIGKRTHSALKTLIRNATARG